MSEENKIIIRGAEALNVEVRSATHTVVDDMVVDEKKRILYEVKK